MMTRLISSRRKAHDKESYQQMLKHIERRTKKEILRLQNAEVLIQREINSTVKSEPVLRQTRLKAYQLLAREKRNLDMMLKKQSELRSLQRCVDNFGRV